MLNKILEKLKDRYSVLVLVLAVVFVVFVFKLTSLTLIKGDEFRELSNSKRLKDIPITAPRGEIRDRYGRLLAGNKVSFTVQLIKDEIGTENTKDRNETILKLIHILNSEGTTYMDELPIIFNSYRYKDGSDYDESGLDAVEKVANIIVENNLIPELIGTSMEYSNDASVPKFITAKKVINILENESTEIPIDANYEDGIVIFSYDERENIGKWQKENEIIVNSDPKGAIIQTIYNRNAEKITMKMLNDPIVSQMAYEMLSDKGLAENIKIEPISLKYEEEYLATKKSLMEEFDSITMETSALDDFINILRETDGIEHLLSQTFGKGDSEDKKNKSEVIPGQIILDKFKENKIKVPIKISVDESSNKPVYKYKNDKEKQILFEKYNLDKNTTPSKAIIKIAEKENIREKSKKKKTQTNSKKTSILESFIKDDRIKGIAQSLVLEKYPNPKISINEWEYTPITEKKSWLNRYNLTEKDDIYKIFKELKKKLELTSDLTDYEARGIMLIVDELNKVGYRGYYPINIAYGINDKTVARLEENKLELPGVKVSLEPVRYYPNGEIASHILGYMGKIAQQEEIDKYIKEKGYLPSTLIGKTGVEVKFEDYLKGEDGSRTVEADVNGNVIKLVEENPAKPGDTLYLTIDLELQKIAEESLDKTLKGIRSGGKFESEWSPFIFGKTYPNAYTGSAVAIDVKTGQALAIANYPGYDPNLFATGISSEDWKSLNPDNDEEGLPLYNIAISSPVQPGSTFKMVTGLAGLENGIEPSKKIQDYGYVQVGDTKFACLIWSSRGGSHGPTDIYKALEKSCNYYFYSVALGRIPKTDEVLGNGMGVEKVIDTAKKLGLDEKTGIEIPGERILGVPDMKSKTRNTKAILERFLKSQLDYFIKEDTKLSEKQIEDAIQEIASWVELEDVLSKRDVIVRLDKLGFDGEKKIPGSRNDLADSIKYDYINAAGWSIADTLNLSIGQGENAYTPLQMANYISIIANGGYKHKISVVDRVQTFDNTKKTYETKPESQRIELNNYKNLEDIGKGMARVTKDEGTARMAFARFPVEVAAKTGTAERAGISPVSKRAYDNYAWFTAYAPYEDNNIDAAQIAVSVVIFQGGSGGYASPVAREIIAEYLGLNKEEEKLNKFDFNTKLAK